MRLYILRHAQAEDLAPDHARELTSRGIRYTKKMASFLKNNAHFDPRQIWHSPYTRAVQTAKIFAESAHLDAKLIEKEKLTPVDDPSFLIPTLNHEKESTLIVGHNPYLALLAGRLLGTEQFTVAVEMKKAALVCLARYANYTPAEPPLWVLRWMLTPQLFEAN